MHATQRTYRSRTAPSVAPPLRLLMAAAMALLIAALIVSSAAHGLVLGEASAQSTLGSHLRVVIPIAAGPGEILDPSCFRVVSGPGGDGDSMVTASVNLERVAAGPRLVVTTARMVDDPTLRLGVQAECDGVARRSYVLLLEPPGVEELAGAAAMPVQSYEGRPVRLTRRAGAAPRNAGGPALAAKPAAPLPAIAANNGWTPVLAAGPTLASPPMVRAPAPAVAVSESLISSAAASTLPPPQAAPLPDASARGLLLPSAAPEAAAREHVAAAGATVSTFRQGTATSESDTALTPLSTLPPRPQPASTPTRAQAGSEGNGAVGYLVGAGLGLIGAIVLAVLLARRQAPPQIPQWTRSRSPTFLDTRSFTEISGAAPTRTRTQSRTVATTMPGVSAAASTSRLRPDAGPPTSRRDHAPIDPSQIDTLLDAIDSDFAEEKAVREAWAAARSDVERELDGNAILQAIEAAERDMHLAPPAPAQAAIERALEDDLLRPQPRR